MSRPKLKTEATTVKMTPEVKQLWELAATHERRTLANMFEVMVRKYCDDMGVFLPTRLDIHEQNS
ncbi:hypothetical protein WI84_24415 [Burkholderia ubonensis]|uniref:hypothetical protein n=1 Tax=Burkholderia TaxID=32008 RepID=UPI00075D4EC2|nr:MULTISPECIES: hypothetical protein [Burkholderia]KVD31754.1 hypothetical protein WI84_24415 [Burkholderia ubonensis]ONB63536.1 hypothetical protein AQ902_22060 [Burkholderia pseudomallei]ONC04155.1 hypothetical protein AQ909_03240 [Burkholderia pseudomallei]